MLSLDKLPLPQRALVDHAGLLHYPSGSDVLGDATSLDAVQVHLVEAERDHGAHSLGHEAPAPVVPGERVSELGPGVMRLPGDDAAGADEAMVALVHDPPVRLTATLVLAGREIQEGPGVLDGAVRLPDDEAGHLRVGGVGKD